MKKIWIDRSRYESSLHCLRERWYTYHAGGKGIVSARKPLPLAVGGAVHAGLAALLRACIGIGGDSIILGSIASMEDAAVRAALADFSQYRRALDTRDEHLGLSTDAPKPVETEAAEDYLYAEQSALVEGMVRAYARRRLRPLVEQYEVLEVEREGQWLLSTWPTAPAAGETPEDWGRELWFMSRPDALLRDRQTNQLLLLSYKTASGWDWRREQDAMHDMQGLSEGVEVERRLAGWWEYTQRAVRVAAPDGGLYIGKDEQGNAIHCPIAMRNFLSAQPAPPRISAIRYEFLLKGDRRTDKELSAELQSEVRIQRSHLIRQYVAQSVPARGTAGYAVGDVCWSWDFIRDDQRSGSLAWQNWRSRGVWTQPGGVRAWIDALDEAAMLMSEADSTLGIEPLPLGYKCDAQAVGVTAQHPLDAVFTPPVIVYRNDDELRDLVDQMESRERGIAEGVAEVATAASAGERRHLLNAHFPMNRRACVYPSSCGYAKLCYGGAELQADPVGSGLYTIRTVNHPQEDSDAAAGA